MDHDHGIGHGAHGDAGDAGIMGRDDAGRCPNCARKVHFWHNHSGYCSKECRTDSITSCPNCGRIGLYKHARLGCCSEDCRYWYVAGLLGYDRDALLTPAWDKVVYHVRLPSTSAEISSLQLDELEYDRAVDTILVIAAPAWMTRSKVLAELPYERFDNAAWQHLWADATLTEQELFEFHRLCYEDDLVCQKLGEHVFIRLRQNQAPPDLAPSGSLPHNGYLPAATVMAVNGYLPAATGAGTTAVAAPYQPTQAMGAYPTASGRLASPPAPARPPTEFVDNVRGVFEGRGYSVETGAAEHTLLLRRQGRLALAAYQYHGGMVDIDPVQRALAATTNAGASQTFVITNGHFTLQAEDFAAQHPIQLIDGDELAELVASRRAMPTLSESENPAPDEAPGATRISFDHGHVAVTHQPPVAPEEPVGAEPVSAEPVGAEPTRQIDLRAERERAEMLTATPVERRPQPPDGQGRPQNNAPYNGNGHLAPVDAEIVGGEGPA